MTGHSRNYLTGSGPRLSRRLLVLALAALVTSQTATTVFSQEEVPPGASAQESNGPNDPMKSEVLQIRRGSFVEVRLIGGEQLRGRLGDILDVGFMIRTVSNNRVVDLQVRFEELSSVRPVSNPKTRDQAFDKNLRRTREIMAIVATGVTVGLVAVVLARSGH